MVKDMDMKELKLKAKKMAETMSLPSRYEEEWRRTDISGIDFDSFIPSDADIEVDKAFFVKEEVDKKILMLHDELTLEADNVFILNSVSSDNYVYLRIDKDAKISINIKQDKKSISNIHIIIHVLPSVSAEIVVKHDAGKNSFVNLLYSGLVEKNAALYFYDCGTKESSPYRISHSYFRLEDDASFVDFYGMMGYSFIKQRASVELAGKGSDALLLGASVVSDFGHYDFKTVQKHSAPMTHSVSRYNIVAGAGGQAVYQGRIDVKKEARGTDAYLSNKNLLLSDDAEVSSIPTLSISTDDVRCSHGSTSGKIGERELFYLRSRGLDKKEATGLISAAHIKDVLDNVPDTVADLIYKSAEKKIRLL